ncbi:hypothetical protein GE300_06015 [Rhodobacteraceae bacterium 2CG4]|uniref:OmpR/PhoB-type domain-containing protein n=1 Tax=Halovulum marinum TaxID=2662447 RepID=A0A6L5YY36_9RHOB|nr:helix-turn-helix domain-containing protein [Halovulum marinum]MSU89177.1 hypothetical protein [Halovulum marinum]
MPSELKFESELGYVDLPAGQRVTLTASERRALALLMANPKRIMTRDQILDAVSEPGSDKRDRNVDFLINRLRRKLVDDARAPRYIATRYGEGYVWVGEEGCARQRLARAKFVVGPLRGLGDLRQHDDRRRVARALYAAVAAEFADGDVAFAPDCPPAAEFDGARPDHAAELTFYRDGAKAYCIVCLREFTSGRVIAVRRATLDDLASGRVDLVRFARLLIGELLCDRASSPPRHAPLALALLIGAADEEYVAEAGAAANIREIVAFQGAADRRNRALAARNDAQLRALLADDADDANAKLLLAANIFSRYATCGVSMFADGEDTRARDEDEIELLVTQALPYVRANSEHAVVAAQLLHFIGRGYEDLARDLAESAFLDKLYSAGGLAVVGQLRAFAGETDAALVCLNQAIDLSAPGTSAHTFATALKCQALAAAARWDVLRVACTELDIVCRNTGLPLEPMYTDPCQPTPSARRLVQALPRRQAAAMLLFCHYLFARRFRDAQAGRNTLLSLSRLLTDRFGAQIVPPEVQGAFPGLSSERA